MAHSLSLDLQAHPTAELAATAAPPPRAQLAPGLAGETPLEVVRRLLPEHLKLKLRHARQLPSQRQRHNSETVLSTSLPAVDKLLGGGLPKGQLTELFGHDSSGRFSLALTTLAATTAHTYGALVDLGDHFDPQCAEQMGVELTRLLWARARTTREALASAEMLLQAGFPLVVINLGAAPVAGGRGSAAAWIRLTRAAATQAAVLLAVSPYRSSGPAATTVLRARRMRSGWIGQSQQPRLLARFSSRLQLEKMPGRNGDASTDLAWKSLELPLANEAL